jgi:SsrA-binding protein
MAKTQPPSQFIVRNRKAGFKFEVLERLECGIELRGTEVKSLRDGHAEIAEAWAVIRNGEMFLIGAHINPYEKGNVQNHEPTRPRKLLAHRREIRKWEPKVRMEGLTLVPLDLHFNARGIAKATIGLVRGKTLGDKRQALKKAEHKREIDRAMARRRRK